MVGEQKTSPFTLLSLKDRRNNATVKYYFALFCMYVNVLNTFRARLFGITPMKQFVVREHGFKTENRYAS